MISDIKRQRLADCFASAKVFANSKGVVIKDVFSRRIFDDMGYRRNLVFRQNDGVLFGVGFSVSPAEIDSARFK
jgi:hypothetical protein